MYAQPSKARSLVEEDRPLGDDDLVPTEMCCEQGFLLGRERKFGELRSIVDQAQGNFLLFGFVKDGEDRGLGCLERRRKGKAQKLHPSVLNGCGL